MKVAKVGEGGVKMVINNESKGNISVIYVKCFMSVVTVIENCL